MNLDQFNGIVRGFVPAIVTLLTAYGLIPTAVADQVTQQALSLIAAAALLTSTGVSVWSWYKNKTSAKAQSVIREVPGTTITVPASAPPSELKDMAADPSVPNIAVR